MVENVNSWFSLSGRIALITGGSSGIGKMIAEAFIAAGAKVYICARDAAACQATATSLGPHCIPLSQDISSVEGCVALAETLAQRENALHILVNNAGVAWKESFATFPESGWDKVVDLNLKTPFFLTQKLFPLLKADATPDQPGKVINIASIDGYRLNDWETYSYAASKAALIHLTRRMAATLIRDSINVTAIAPGAFASKMNRAARDRGQSVSKVVPSQRIGDAVDIGAGAIYLAARSGNYVVGSTLTVDGGLAFAELGASIDG